MSRNGLIWTAILLFVGLTFACLMFNRADIEADATNKAIAALSSNGINTSALNIDYDGVDATISGAPSAELRDRIYEIVKNQDGYWGNVTVEASGATSPTEVTTPAGNFGKLRMEYDDNSVKVDGTVSTEENKDAIHAALVNEFGADKVENNLNVDSSHDSFSWLSSIPQIIKRLRSRVTNGGIDAEGDKFRLFGTVPSAEDGTTIAKEITELSGWPSIESDLNVSAAQFDINRALAGKTIEFNSGSSKLFGGGMSILDEVVAIMKRYPDVSVAVEGHTDNDGSKATNESLSQARAKSCLDYMIQKGIDSSRITSAGFGDAKPIRSNQTNEGRSKNRRVAFTVR